MQNIAADQARNYCPCGAVCAVTNTRCPKCIARLRWLRRKAWRTHPVHRQKTRQPLSGERRPGR